MTERIVHFGKKSSEPGFTYIFGVQEFEARPGCQLRSGDGTLYTVVEYEPGMARCISDEPFVTDEMLESWFGPRERRTA